MLAAVGAVKIASMWSLAGADDAHVATARLFAIDRAVELDIEADDAVGPGCRHGHGDLVAANHVAAKGASCGAQVDHGALPERSRRLACQSAMR